MSEEEPPEELEFGVKGKKPVGSILQLTLPFFVIPLPFR